MKQVIIELQDIARNVMTEFGSLTKEQLNWKPETKKWSIAQCLHHIITSNETYFPIFEKIIQHEYKPGLWEKLNPFSRYFGNKLIESTLPDKGGKMIAPRIFIPASGEIPLTIISRFEEHQKTLATYFEKTAAAGSDKIIISSPVSKAITYPLTDCFNILVAHEQRHVLQAKRLKQLEQFPK